MELKDLDLSDQQAVFDYVFEKVYGQGVRSTRSCESGGETCAYRGNDGRKCAIGWLIDDEHYHPSLEGLSVETIVEWGQSPNTWTVPKKTLVHARDLIAKIGGTSFARDLQSVHDRTINGEWRPEFKSRMKNVAEKYKLDWKFG